MEAFEAEVAGVVDAITSGVASGSLQFVTFIELNPKRAGRMQQTLRGLLPNVEDRRETVFHADTQAATDRLRAVGYDSQSKPHVFVAVPFAEDLTDYFHYGIAPVIRSGGLLCERADEEVFTGDVLAWIRERIKNATLVVADLSRANPNVYLEVGLAWGFGVPTLLLCGPDSTPLFDVAGQRILLYKSIRDLEDKLRKMIEKLTPPLLNEG